jgi:type I restriction enzyme S subunit
MRSEWPLVRLADHVESCLGKMLDAKKNRGVLQPYLGNSNVRWGKFDISDLAEMRFEAHEDERYSLRAGDLVVCEGGEPGRCAIWNGPTGMKIQKALHRIRPKETLDTYYLFYWFCLASKAGNLESHFTGTTIKHLTGKALAALKVPLPPIGTQRAMVDVLRSLDDRITLLHETNASLEAIAQALFKSWFVDFDPVRAKAEGLEPEGMDATTAAFFPDQLEESKLGFVPCGWLIGELRDLLILQRGFDLPANDRVAGDYPLIAASGPSGTHKIAMAKGPGVVTGRSGVLGKVFLTLEDYWPLNTTLWVKEFKHATPCYAYELLRLLDLSLFNAGSAVPTLNRNHIHGLRYVLPPLELVHAYEDVAKAFHLRILENCRHARTLAQLRDTLLPRLISGQLRLPVAQELVEEVCA